MHLILYILLLFLIITTDGCDDKIEDHLGTKTPYRFVANNNYDKNETLSDCVKKIWMISRHGTRVASASLIQNMQSFLPILIDIIMQKNLGSKNSKILKSDLHLFDKWKLRYHEGDHKKLTIEGEYELLELAERMQVRFPEIIPPIYSNTSYKFKYTKSQRTKRSAESFVIGLFDRRTLKDVYFPEALKQDPILRFYKLCPKWRSTVKHNDSTYDERTKFLKSQLVKDALQKISDKLQLDNVLSFTDASLMYTTCGFETAWSTKRKSPWCLPFDLDTIKILEYAEDLRYYWSEGYGHQLTYKQACPAFKDMIEFILNDDPYPKSVFYFTHSGTILKFLTHLGLYKDERSLRHDNYRMNSDRKWRVSKIDSFGSNLAFLLYDCNNEKKLLVLHNEMPVRLPCCPDDDHCDMKTVLKYYDDSINKCEFDKMCEKVSVK